MGSASHNTLGLGMGALRCIGKKGCIETFPISQIKRVRLVQRADGYDGQFAVQAERKIAHKPAGKQVGIDGGLKAFYTASDGPRLPIPGFCARQKPNSSACIGASPAKPGVPRTADERSNAWQKARLRASRQRKDCAVKAASALCTSRDVIASEDLKIASLVKNHRLAKSISDASWGLFLSWVRYYGTLHGIPVLAVSPRSTTQECSGCDFRVKKTRSQRTHLCPQCGLVLDRDWNAALNIRLSALAWGAAHRTAGQAETGTASAARNASGQTTAGRRGKPRSGKVAG
jgi:putative transposase